MAKGGSCSASARAAVYEIRVQGRVDGTWTEWFSGMAISSLQTGDGLWVTTLTGTLPDQAALRGLLSRIWDLNLTLIAVKRTKLA